MQRTKFVKRGVRTSKRIIPVWFIKVSVAIGPRVRVLFTKRFPALVALANVVGGLPKITNIYTLKVTQKRVTLIGHRESKIKCSIEASKFCVLYLTVWFGNSQGVSVARSRIDVMRVHMETNMDLDNYYIEVTEDEETATD
jgi:hypothetical protein